MAEQERLDASKEQDDVPEKKQEQFVPVGTMVLMIAYILIFAAAWGLVYFNDLLMRR
jgi:hypothetical protein